MRLTHKQSAHFISYALMGMGVLVLLGWAFDIAVLKSLSIGLVPMKVNIALAFVFLGASLRLFGEKGQTLQWVGLACAGVGITLGLLTLMQYLLGWNLGIDQLFSPDLDTAVTSFPGRMSPPTALCFVLAGSALLFYFNKRYVVSHFAAILAGFIALPALIGYLYNIRSLFEVFVYSSMALHTAVAFILLALGILLLRIDVGIMPLISSDTTGGMIARRLIPVAIVVPIVLGAVIVVTQQISGFDTTFSISLLVLLNIVVLCSLLLWSAQSLQAVDLKHRQSEEQTRLVVEASPNAIILVDTTGHISLVNERAEALFGYKRDELPGQPIEMLVPPEFRAYHNDYRNAFLNAPTTRPMGAGRDLFGLRKDGSQVPIEIGLNPITTADGSFILASVIDITERKRAEDQFRLAVEASPSAIIMVDTAGKISLVNAQTEKLFGYQRDELLGQPIEMLVSPEFRTHHNDYRNAFLNAPTARPMGAGRDLFGLRKDGSHVPVEIGLNPITTIEGSFVLASVIDITERKRAEAEITESLRREQAARVEAEAAQQRLAFLVEAGTTLASSLDYHATLAAVAQLAVPRIADWCAIDILESDGLLNRVAVVHTNPAKVELAYELQRRYPPDPDAPRGVYHVLRTGRPDFYPEVPEALLEAAGQNEEHLNLIRELGLKSGIVMPIVVREQVLGVITFVMAESDRHYSEADLVLTEELAGRTALAIDNAQLYTEAKKLNEDLEQRVIERTTQLEDANAKLKREIIERKWAEEELQRRRQELQDHIDSMSTLSAKLALDGSFLLVNKVAQEASGLSMETLMQTNFLEGQWWAFDPEVQARVRHAFQRARTGITVNYDEQIFVFDQILTISFSLVPVAGPDGQVAYIVAEGRDITPLKRAEEALRAHSTQLEAANKELEAFAYSVSHDLRAPLRGIDGFSQALLEDYADDLDPGARHYLGRVRAASQRMSELIDDLLALSRLTRSEMHPETVNLSALVQTIVAELRREEPERQVEFVIASNVTVRADAQLIRIALENLLGNAWKFSAKQPTACIEFGVLPQSNGRFTYFIRDDGAGFDMAYADKLFGAFQRLHTPAEFSGTGIGLATVQRVIHRHGGRVWAEGVVDEGATFYFTL